jgi:hypothetical protein
MDAIGSFIIRRRENTRKAHETDPERKDKEIMKL